MQPPGQSALSLEAKEKYSRRKLPEAVLELPAHIVPDAAVRALIDSCIVPALVQKFIKEKHTGQAEQSHSGELP